MHRSKQRPEALRNSSVSAGPPINTLPLDQSFTDEALDSGGQYDFTVKNNLYELQSRCNTLEYDKYKRAISYIETTNQLQNKTEYLAEMNAQLTHQVQALSDQRDILRTVLGEVREQNYSFSKEINLLKMELNRIINSQGSPSYQDRSESIQIMKNHLQQKEKEIQMLNQHLKSAQKVKMTESVSMQQERQKVKIQSELSQANRRQSELKIEIEELARHYKRKQVEQKEKYAYLENEIKRHLEEIQQKQRKMESLKQQYVQLSKELQEKTNRYRLIEDQRSNLQNRLCEVELQVGRLKCQKSNLQQYKNYLETVNQENESKRKSLQQQIYKLQSENSEIREQIFSEKLQTKKQASKFKLQMEEQRIRLQQIIAEKQQQIKIMKQQVNQNQRGLTNSVELPTKSKNQGDLEKANQKILDLTSQIQELKKQLQNAALKLEKKHDKYCALENKLKAQNSQRIQQLQTEIYKQQKIIGQLEYKLQFSSNLRKSQKVQKTAYNDNMLVENLKDEISQKQRRLKQYQRNVNQMQLKLQTQEDKIFRLQQQRANWEMNAVRKQQKISAIKMLQQEIVRLNRQLKVSLNNEDRWKQELSSRQKKMSRQMAQMQSNIKRKTDQIETLSRKKYQYQQEIKMKESIIKSKETSMSKLNEDINKLRQQKMAAENNNKSREEMIRTAIANEQISKNQMKRIREDLERQSQNDITMLNRKIQQLENQNITLKEDYTEALQQINTLLFKYQNLEQSQKRNQMRQDKYSTTRAQNLEHQCERLRVCLQREEAEVKRLTQMLSSSSKLRSATSNNKQKINKITQPLWLGEERFSIARLGDNSRGHSRQKYYHQP